MKTKNFLWHAANAGDLKRLQEEYRQDPGNLLTVDSKQKSALHVAMAGAVKNLDKYQKTVYFLLDVGHPLYVKNESGQTPLDYDEESLKKILVPWLLSPQPKNQLSSLDIALLIARLGNDPKLVVIIKSIEIEQVKSQQLASQESLRLNDEEQHQFHQKLYKLTQEDEYQKVIALISEEIVALCKKLLSVDRINVLIKGCSHPTIILDRAALKAPAKSLFTSLWQSVDKRIEAATRQIKNLISLISKLVEEHKFLPDYQRICELLDNLKAIYEQFCTRVRNVMTQSYGSDSEQEKQLAIALQPPHLIYTLDLRGRELLPDAGSYLDIEHRDNERGRHTIRRFSEIHFKRHRLDSETQKAVNPCDPSVEFMVASLHNTVAAQVYGVAPTEIVRTVQRGNASKIFIASNNVSGINLDVLIRTKPEDLNHCDEYSFAGITITGFLTLPNDGKFDNYIAQFMGIKGTKNFTVRFVGVDNDQSFASPIIVEEIGSDTHGTEVIFVFFLFPQMDKKIDQKFRDQLLARPAALIMLEWLKALYKQNEQYLRLLSENVLSKAEWDSLLLPMRFVPGRLSFVYQQLQKLQDYLKAHPDCTYNDIFIHLYPRLGKYYQALRVNHKDCQNPVLSAFETLWRSTHIEKEIGAVNGSDLERTPSITTAQRDDFLLKRTQVLPEAIEEFLRDLDFADLEERSHLLGQLVLGELRGFQLLRNLTIRNCSVLEISLKNLLGSLPNLQALNLVSCPNVTAKDLSIAVLARPDCDNKPIAISIYNCSQITRTGYEDLASRRQIKLMLVATKPNQEFHFSHYESDYCVRQWPVILQERVKFPREQLLFLMACARRETVASSKTFLAALLLLIWMSKKNQHWSNKTWEKQQAPEIIQANFCFFVTSRAHQDSSSPAAFHSGIQLVKN